MHSCSRLKSRKTFCCFCCCSSSSSFYCFLFTVSISCSCLLPLCSWGEAGCYLFTLTPPLPSPSRSRICNDLLMSLKDALCGSLFYALIWWTFKESRKVPRSEREARGSSSHLALKCAFLVFLHVNVEIKRLSSESKALGYVDTDPHNSPCRKWNILNEAHLNRVFSVMLEARSGRQMWRVCSPLHRQKASACCPCGRKNLRSPLWGRHTDNLLNNHSILLTRIFTLIHPLFPVTTSPPPGLPGC